jgi:ribosomal protein L11 methyltransferase
MSLTFELQIRFVLELEKALPLKREVLSWLRREGYEQVVESLIDGIDFPVEEFAGDESSLEVWQPSLIDREDAAPIAVYDAREMVIEALVEELLRAFPHGIELIRTSITNESWSMAWDEDTSVIQTDRFVVLYPGTVSPNSSLIPLYIHPGEAFGSGRHATTKVALEMLEKLYLIAPDTAAEPLVGTKERSQASRRMLDVGTGNGILLLAGSKIGFKDLLGTEIDQAVLDEARANLALGEIDARLILAPKPPVAPDIRYDLVTANILAPVLHELMPIFAASLDQGGLLLLAGFVAKEEPGIVDSARKNGLVVRMRGECRGWVGLALQRA